MQRFWKKWNKVILVSALLVLGYFILRLTNLTSIPIFTDEAIYIRWSQIGARDANWRFISLVDGKQPLFAWIMMVYLKIIKTDPLWVGRFVSVTAGFGSIVGIWFLAYELFRSKKIAFLSCFMYLICPFTLMYDRMALYDSLVATFYIWNLYLAIILVRRIRLDIALIFGMTLGLGMLNKSSGFISLYLVPFSLFLFDWRSSNRKINLIRWIALVGLAAVIAEAFYSVLRLSPLLHMVTEKNAVFIYPLREWFMHPFRFVIGNLRGMFDWQIHYLTVPLFYACLIPFVIFWKKPLEKIVLLIWWIAPFVGLALFGRVLYPRFILFMCMPFLILAAIVIDWIWKNLAKKIIGIIILLILLIPSIYTDYFIVENPKYAPIPASDSNQYINDWPSGWGIKEVNAFFAKEAKSQKIAVYTDGTFGLLPYAVEIYLVENPNIKIQGIWPLPEQLPEMVLKDASLMPTYFILNETQIIPEKWNVQLIAQYAKGTHPTQKLRLLKVIPPTKTNL